jgi:hypothetical protein
VQVQRPQGSPGGIAIGDVGGVTVTELSANSLFGTLVPLPPARAGERRVGAAMLAEPGG